MQFLVHSSNRVLCLLRSKGPFARAGLRAFSLSAANQIVSSGTNFLLALVLVRWLDAAGFGVYGIAIAGMLLFSGVGNALLLTQMVVHLPSREPAEVPGYFGRYLVLVAGLALALLVLVIMGGQILQRATWGPDLSRLLVVSGLGAAGYLGKDFFIRASYSLRREGAALAINCGVAAAILGVLLVFGQVGVTGPVQAVGVYAFGQWCGVLLGLIVCRQQLRFRDAGPLSEVAREAMAGGRWALGGVVVAWLQSQAYLYTTALFVGASGVGHANAARIFVAPVLMVAPALNQITVPRLASMRILGDRPVVKAGIGLTAAVLASGVAYLVILAGLYPAATAYVLPANYHDVGPLVLAWGVVVLAQLARDGASTLMQVFHQFRRLTLSAAAVASLALPAAAVLASAGGEAGAVWATALAELALAAVLWKWVRRHGD